MRTERSRATGWLRVAALLGIALAGLATLVGSGGGFPPPCVTPDCFGPLTPSVSIAPTRTTVQVGRPVSFVATALFADDPVRWQWRRDGTDIDGATQATYTLAAVNLGDDGAEFTVVVRAANGEASARALLRVSSAPAVIFEDADFAVSDWSVSAVADPAVDGPTQAVSRAADGGNPGAFRAIEYGLPPGRGTIQVFHAARNAAYDPAALGAVYVVDMALECNRLSTDTLSETSASPAFEQSGRWYAAASMDLCAPTWWTLAGAGLQASDFRRIAGPACGSGKRCPDFSAGAAPLRFGFVTGQNAPADAAGGSVVQGIDNWRVRVWRR